MVSRGTAVGVANVQGEDQKKLDVVANDLFINMLKSSFEVSHTHMHTHTHTSLDLTSQSPSPCMDFSELILICRA